MSLKIRRNLMMLNSFLLVGAGGALGSMLRYGLSVLIGARPFPYATFSANILGCFVIGILFGLGLKHSVSAYSWKFLGIGICGGFTTFSAFSLESIEFLQQERFSAFFLYMLLSITFGCFATYVGYLIVKS